MYENRHNANKLDDVKRTQFMIFSLQSTVIHGYVGHCVALPLYHAFGLVTDHLDTVRLAAHPGHGTSTKQVLSADKMGAFLADYVSLKDRQAVRALHTGYFGSAEQVLKAADFISHLRAENPQMLYLLDPVFGDKGKAYVSDDIIEAISTHLLPLASIITPNQFELSLLAQSEIQDLSAAQTALTGLSHCHADLRLVTGMPTGQDITDMLVTDTYCITHQAPAATYGVSGAGDAFAALFLAHLQIGKTADQALHQASAITHHMIAQSKSPLTLDLASGLKRSRDQAIDL